MKNRVLIFLALYILVGQPIILGWMLSNTELYELAGFNAFIVIIALIIGDICKISKAKKEEKNEDKVKLIEKSEEKVSRIENDNGVAIVEVEKKTEVVVETNNSENSPEPLAAESEGLVEKNEEKLEENLEEKAEEPEREERPMREPITIPKIVQPLTGHPTPKKRKRESRWGQWLVLLLTLGIAVVIAITLWEFLDRWGIAIALFLGRILYLIIGKLFDINGFYNAKTLFTNWLYVVLILAGIGYGIYSMQNKDKPFLLVEIGDKVSSYVKDLFKSEESLPEINSWDTTYIFEGTGEVIDEVEIQEILDNKGNEENVDTEAENIETENTETENVDTEIENTETEVEAEPENNSDQTLVLSSEEADEEVTMGEAIKSLLAGVTLSTKTNSTFTYVSKSSSLYPYFKTAYEKGMIGTNANPSSSITCDTYITMKGLAEGWYVGSYVKSDIKSVYWNKAVELGKLSGCEKGNYVTKGNL